jgi:transposase InsO family protein
MDEKILFIADYLRQVDSFSQLCGRFGISRKTGYKWIERYEQHGAEALEDRTRKRHTQATQTPYAIQQAILQLRAQRDTPGPKKIQAMLARTYPDQEVPSATTIYNILKRAGKIETRRRPSRVAAYSGALECAATPNELWSADYKGQFKTADGRWCYPLTVMDHASRYLLGCQGLGDTRHEPTQQVFERLFREYGLPQRMRTDNGVPFASVGAGGLSCLSIWWIRLGIVPERIERGKPQQNGRHERMHRTLKRALGQPPAANLAQQQRELDTFRQYYNEQRPHEGLDLKSPQGCYSQSTRPFPLHLPELQYPSYFKPTKVHGNGVVYWGGLAIYVSHLLCGEYVGVEPTGDGVWDIYFGPVRLGRFDQRHAGERGYLRLKV